MLTDENKENRMIIRTWVHLLTNINTRAVSFTSLRVHSRSSRVVNVSVSGLHQSTRRSISTANKSFRNLVRARAWRIPWASKPCGYVSHKRFVYVASLTGRSKFCWLALDDQRSKALWFFFFFYPATVLPLISVSFVLITSTSQQLWKEKQNPER